jgi:hypothetical protein
MARRSAFTRSIILTIAALAPVTALAQTPEPATGAEQVDAVRKESRMHVGGLYLTPSIHLKEFGVDSNVFNAAGEQKSDFTFTLTPKADLYVPVARRALLQSTVETDLVWYTKYDTERSVDPQFTTRGEVFLRRITLFAENRFHNTRQRLNYEVDLRARHVENATSVGASVRLTPKFSIEAAGRRDELRFDGDTFFEGASLQRTLNQTTIGLSLVARDRVTPLTTVVVRVERLEDEFAYSPARDSRSIRVQPGIEFKPRALVKGSAYLGYRKFTPSLTGALPEFSGIVAQVGLSYTLMGATTFGVSYSRDLTYSYEELQPFFVNNRAGVSVRRALGRRLDVVVSADRHAYDYKNLLTLPVAATPLVPAAPRRDLTWNYAGNIGYRIGQARVAFGVSYWERESQMKTLRDYDNFRFGTNVTYGF